MNITRGYHLTVRDLRLLQACAAQVETFKAEWPDGVTLTEAALLRAAELRLDLGWFAGTVLPAPLRAAYNAQVKPLWDAFCAQVDSLRDAYNAQVEPLWDAYDARVKPLRAAYDAQVRPLRAAFCAQVARVLWAVLPEADNAAH